MGKYDAEVAVWMLICATALMCCAMVTCSGCTCSLAY